MPDRGRCNRLRRAMESIPESGEAVRGRPPGPGLGGAQLLGLLMRRLARAGLGGAQDYRVSLPHTFTHTYKARLKVASRTYGTVCTPNFAKRLEPPWHGRVWAEPETTGGISSAHVHCSRSLGLRCGDQLCAPKINWSIVFFICAITMLVSACPSCKKRTSLSSVWTRALSIAFSCRRS